MSDEKLYLQVENELKGKPRKYTDKALMSKAMAVSGGDETKAKYKYIELRVKKLKEIKEAKEAKELNKQKQFEKNPTEDKPKSPKTVKERIGYVFHWIGFLACVLSIIGWGYIWFDNDFKEPMIYISIGTFSSLFYLGIGWTINYVLTGKKDVYPFLSKETKDTLESFWLMICFVGFLALIIFVLVRLFKFIF